MYEYYECDCACVYERQLITVCWCFLLLNHWHINIKYIKTWQYTKNIWNPLSFPNNLFFRLFVFQANLYWFGNGPTIAGGRGSLACHLVMPGFMGQARSNSIGTKEVQLYKGLNLRSRQWSWCIDFMRLVQQLQYGIPPLVLHNLASPDKLFYQWLLPLIHHVSFKTAQNTGIEWSNFVLNTCYFQPPAHLPRSSIRCIFAVGVRPFPCYTSTSWLDDDIKSEVIWAIVVTPVFLGGREVDVCSTNVRGKMQQEDVGIGGMNNMKQSDFETFPNDAIPLNHCKGEVVDTSGFRGVRWPLCCNWRLHWRFADLCLNWCWVT